jgi:hypothetical protein
LDRRLERYEPKTNRKENVEKKKNLKMYSSPSNIGELSETAEE